MRIEEIPQLSEPQSASGESIGRYLLFVIGYWLWPAKKPNNDIAVLLDESKSEQFSLPVFISVLENKLGWRVDVVVLNRAGEGDIIESCINSEKLN